MGEQHYVDATTVIDRLESEQSKAKGTEARADEQDKKGGAGHILSDTIIYLEAFRRGESQRESFLHDDNRMEDFHIDYEFSCSAGSLGLNSSLQDTYSVQVLNVSLPE